MTSTGRTSGADEGVDAAPRDLTRRLVARRLAVGFAGIALSGIVAGMVLVHALAGSALVRWDEDRVAAFVVGRTPSLNRVSAKLSTAANAPGIIAIGIVIAVVFALCRSWFAHVWWLVGATAVILLFELLSFLAINEVVRRKRPETPHLGSVPSTGSFPSGHVAATLVVFGFVALVLAGVGARGVWIVAAWVWAGAAALAVGWSRVYRGLHHPLDVVAGFLLGATILVVFAPVVMRLAAPRRRSPLGATDREKGHR